MKKTVLTLVGTAVLFSVLASYSVTQEQVGAEAEPSLNKNKKGKKAYFQDVERVEKSELEEYMAKTLSNVTGIEETLIKTYLSEGKTAKEIVLLSGNDEQSVEEKLTSIHKQNMKEKVSEQVKMGALTKEKARQIMAKLESGLS